MTDWLDGLLEPSNPFQVKKSAWPATMDLGEAVCPVRKDWVGQGFFYIVDTRNGFMPPMINLWAYENRLEASANTVKGYLTDIAILLEHIDNKGRPRYDLHRRFAQLEILKNKEVQEIIAALSYKNEKGEIKKVALSTLARRLTSVREFLLFGYERYLERVTDDKKYNATKTRLNKVRKWFNKATPSRSEVAESTASPVPLSNEQLAVLRFVITPQKKHNPFSPRMGGALQYRNAALLSLMLESGVRPSELCLLERGDLFPERQSVWISKWSPDSLEAHHNQTAEYRKRAKFPRKVTVGHKTSGREVSLSAPTMDMLQIYLDDHRQKFLKDHGKKRSRYLFLSSADGGPITTSGVASVVKTIAAAYPALGRLVSYSFRHTSVTVSAEALRSALAGVDALSRDQKIREFLTNKYGWSPTSDMPDHYGREDLNKLLTELSSEEVKSQSTYSNTSIVEPRQREAANDSE